MFLSRLFAAALCVVLISFFCTEVTEACAGSREPPPGPGPHGPGPAWDNPPWGGQRPPDPPHYRQRRDAEIPQE